MAGRDLDTADSNGDNEDDQPKVGFWERIRLTILKPAKDGQTGPTSGIKTGDEGPSSVEDLELAIARADDKERAVGLVGAPVAAAIALFVMSYLVNNDPSATLNGAVNHQHVNPSLYYEVGGTACVLAILMLVMALLRKRLYLGIVMALYGLSIFNLHFWGFGLPYIMAGAWLLVRAYRLGSKLKLTKAVDNDVSGPKAARPKPSKRYTPPTVPPKRPSNPDKDQKAS